MSGDKAALEASTFGVITELPTPQLILDAFNGKNNSTLQLTIDVTVDNIKAKKSASKLWVGSPVAPDFSATINVVVTSRAIFGSAYIKILVNPQKTIYLKLRGESLRLRIITDDITKNSRFWYFG